MKQPGIRRVLDRLASRLRRPHHDAPQRLAQQEAAARAERNPRREGEGIHPGSH